MGLFENFPYTNFHNLNLDWIIKVLKNAVAELEEIQTNWESVRDTANTAKTTADTAAVKAENARITANGAMTKADAAKTQSENAELTANAARATAEDAQATSHESDEKAARAEIVASAAQSTANAAKKTADGVDAKANTAIANSQQATEIATEADSTATAAAKKATNADSKVDALTTTVNTIGKTANNAMSLAQTNEKDIAGVEADITELQTRYKRTISTQQVWTPAQSAYILTTADFDRGIYTLSIDYSEDVETLSYFDTISSPFVALDNLHCYLGSNLAQCVFVPAIVAQHPTSSKPTAVVYFLLPKTQPNITNGDRLYVQFETETVSRTIGLNT